MIIQEPEEEQMEPQSEKMEDMEALKKACAEEKAQAEANLAGWQRERADFLNYKRRIEQEKEDIIKSATSGLMLRLLPALDDFDRALACIPAEVAEAKWTEGIKAIERKLKSILEGQGLSDIKAIGKPFDPTEHEAVMQGPGEEGVVVTELQKGYKLYDNILRPTKAVVGNGEKEKKEET